MNKSYIVIDPGFHDYNSHHHQYNNNLYKAVRNTAVQFQVFASRRLEQKDQCEFEIQSYFKTECYINDLKSLGDDEFENISDEFASELVNLFDEVNGSKIEILIHTCFSVHIYGLAKALSITKKVPKNIFVSLMFDPGEFFDEERQVFDRYDDRKYFHYTLSLRALESISKKKKVKLLLATTCQGYKKVYQTIVADLKICIHPTISRFSLEPTTEEKNTVLVYIGSLKSDKGVEFSCSVAIAGAILYPDVEFLFHFNSNFENSSKYIQIFTYLESAAVLHKNIKLFKGELSDEKYIEVLSSCELICLLYDPDFYKYKTSGILFEALLLEKRLVVTSDTWLSHELKSLEYPHKCVEYLNVGDALQSISYSLSENKNDKVTKNDYFKVVFNSFKTWYNKNINI